MTIDVESVCTDAQLDEYLGGKLTAGVNLLPTEWADASPARQYALRRTLQALARRSPPILEGDISDVTQLHDAVLFGACARLYDLAMTAGGESEVFYLQSKRYDQKFRDELASLVITGPELQRVVSRAPALYRR